MAENRKHVNEYALRVAITAQEIARSMWEIAQEAPPEYRHIYQTCAAEAYESAREVYDIATETQP